MSEWSIPLDEISYSRGRERKREGERGREGESEGGREGERECERAGGRR